MEKDKDSNVVFIGGKPFGNYLTAVGMQVNRSETIIIKSRGKYTARAIDVALTAARLNNLEVKDIKIDTETFQPKKEGERETSVSTIELTLIKK
jgi:DNA-binding protein Alba